MQLSIIVEGNTDIPVARRLARDAGFGQLREHVLHGKARLDAVLPKYLEASHWQPYLILRDLDDDALCAPEWIAPHHPGKWSALRLAVRTVEAWLLADRERFADFFGISKALISVDPDGLKSPKEAVVALAAKSRRRAIREGMCPGLGKSAKVGPGYAALVMEFSTGHWRPEVAARSSPSLRRARSALESLARRWKSSSGVFE